MSDRSAAEEEVFFPDSVLHVAGRRQKPRGTQLLELYVRPEAILAIAGGTGSRDVRPARGADGLRDLRR
jgi:hypothetical protein